MIVNNSKSGAISRSRTSFTRNCRPWRTAVSVRCSSRMIVSAAGGMAGPLEDEHALARGLRVEEPVGLVGLLELEAVGEQARERDPPPRDEARALGLGQGRERPRGG